MALWIFLLIVLAVAFVFVHAYLLPKLFLKEKYDYSVLPDRGLNAIDEEGGRSVVYEPDLSFIKYIKRYVLSERDGKKIIICKIDDSVRFLDYDIVLFDKNGNSFKVLNVKELVNEKGVTREVALPEKTVYVSVVLNAVNDVKFRNKASRKVLMKGIALDLTFGALTEIISVLCAKILIGKLLGDIFFESFIMLGSTWVFTALICVSLIVINALFTFAVVFLRSKKNNGVETNVVA